MNLTKKLNLFSAGVILALTLNCGPESDYTHLYQAKPLAPGLSSSTIRNLDLMGAHQKYRGTQFSIYSERATRVELLLFDDPDSKNATQVYQMSRFGNVWSIYIEGVVHGQYYGFRAWGPNWPYSPSWYPGSMAGFIVDVDTLGNRFNPNKLIVDPYAKAFHRGHDWAKGMAASGVFRAQSTIAAASKAIVIDSSKYSWSAGEQSYWSRKQAGQTLKPNELIVYEVNLKGLTKNSSSSMYGVTQHGTYIGAGQMASYFKDLGVNVVEFLPIQEAGAEGGFWKYWTIGFMAPEGEYAYRTVKAEHVGEFKTMVEAFHAQGIEVWLDVVYNHSGEGGLWRQKPPKFTGILNLADPNNFYSYDPPETATLINFRLIDNQAYYQLPYNDANAKAAGFYWEHTGVGNGMRANHTPFKRLILDSLRYWVTDMHVDGFRFDLCSQLGEIDQDYGNWSATTTVLQDIIDDPVLVANNARMVAEPWDAGGHYKVGEFSKSASGIAAGSTNSYSWYEWNGQFRDYMRGFLNDDNKKLNTKVWPYILDGGGFLAGSGDTFNKGNCPYCVQRYPYITVNFLTAHDGFTLYDVFSYTNKRNCGPPLNPNCLDPNSGDNNNHSKDWQPEGFKRQIIRNAAMMLFFSNGTPMMLGGDEFMRTQYGNNNAYHVDADNMYNWFRWGSWNNELAGGVYAKAKMRHFFKNIINYRKTNCWAFCQSTYAGLSVLEWWGAQGEGGPQWGTRHIGMRYKNPPVGKKEIFVAINQEGSDIVFVLPAGGNWIVKFDSQEYFEGASGKISGNVCNSGSLPTCNTIKAGGATYGVKGRSIVVFEKQ